MENIVKNYQPVVLLPSVPHSTFPTHHPYTASYPQRGHALPDKDGGRGTLVRLPEEGRPASSDEAGPGLRAPHQTRRGLLIQYVENGLDQIKDINTAKPEDTEQEKLPQLDGCSGRSECQEISTRRRRMIYPFLSTKEERRNYYTGTSGEPAAHLHQLPP